MVIALSDFSITFESGKNVKLNILKRKKFYVIFIESVSINDIFYPNMFGPEYPFPFFLLYASHDLFFVRVVVATCCFGRPSCDR